MSNTAIVLAAIVFMAYMGAGAWIYQSLLREQTRRIQIDRHVLHFRSFLFKHVQTTKMGISFSDASQNAWHFILYKVLNFGVAEHIVKDNKKVLIIAFSALVVIFLIILKFLGSIIALAWIGGWVFIVRQFYTMLNTKYLKKVRDQLPETVGLLVRALRVGTPLNKSLQLVALEMPEPTKSLFQEVMDEVAIGTDLPTSFSMMSRRVGLPGYAFLSVVIALQATAGGGLADVMMGVEKTVRDRLEVQKRGIAATGEARMTSYILLGLPICVVMMVFLEDPVYFNPMFESETGKIILGVAVGLWCFGFYCIRWLIGRITK
ncbi:MAG: type II secretion system F family protein [Acetobacter sp.]|nr:type II secretion system F family protein [Acetobacter sp.]